MFENFKNCKLCMNSHVSSVPPSHHPHPPGSSAYTRNQRCFPVRAHTKPGTCYLPPNDTARAPPTPVPGSALCVPGREGGRTDPAGCERLHIGGLSGRCSFMLLRKTPQ